MRNGINGKKVNEEEALKHAVAVAKWNRDSGKGIYETNSRARREFINQTTQQIMKSRGLSNRWAENRIKELTAGGTNEEEAKKQVQRIMEDGETDAKRRVEEILADMESFEV